MKNSDILKDTLFIITFDEDNSAADNRIYTVLVGAGVKSGVTNATHYNHYDLLRTIEDIFEIGNLGRHDASATTIEDIWK